MSTKQAPAILDSYVDGDEEQPLLMTIQVAGKEAGRGWAKETERL